MGNSSIEWTEETWNPVTGCTKVSDGCDNCYAHVLANGRLADVYGKRLPVVDTPENRADPFAVRAWPERLREPGSWRKPQMVFVNSMSDLFHVDVPEPFLREIFEVMLRVDRHTYQVLTKRPGRALRFFERNRDLFPGGVIPSHIWMGTSVENQDAAFRVRQLQDLPAAVRFLSCEPLLGELDLRPWIMPLACTNAQWHTEWPYYRPCGWYGTDDELDLTPEDDPDGQAPCCPRCGAVTMLTGTRADDGVERIDWIVCGGESGHGARPMHPGWARSLRDQCSAAGVAFFFKQWGEWAPCSDAEWTGLGPVGKPRQLCIAPSGETCGGFLGAQTVREYHDAGWRPVTHVGKHAAGRLLDGREHNEFPVSPARVP